MLRVVQDHAETLKRASKEEKLSKVLYANHLNDLDGYNLHFLFEKAIQNSYSFQSLFIIHCGEDSASCSSVLYAN